MQPPPPGSGYPPPQQQQGFPPPPQSQFPPQGGPPQQYSQQGPPGGAPPPNQGYQQPPGFPPPPGQQSAPPPRGPPQGQFPPQQGSLPPPPGQPAGQPPAGQPPVQQPPPPMYNPQGSGAPPPGGRQYPGQPPQNAPPAQGNLPPPPSTQPPMPQQQAPPFQQQQQQSQPPPMQPPPQQGAPPPLQPPQQPPQQQSGGPPMGAPPMGAPPIGAPPMDGAPGGYPPPQQAVPPGFADPEGGGFDQPQQPASGGAPPGVQPGFRPNMPPPATAQGFPPPPGASGGFPPPPGGGPGGSQAPPPAPVQFFNPAAVAPRKAAANAAAAGQGGAPTEGMANMSMRAPAPAFNLGDLPAGPTQWNPPAAPCLDAEGQTHPRYMQCSVGAIPASSSLAQKFSLPMSVSVHPLNDPKVQEGFTAVPVVNFGNCGVIRCRRCRTYVNPFVAFIDGGRRWRCNVCGLLNDVPSDYYCSLDNSGRRRDHAERYELNSGTVEIIAPADYMVRPPQAPAFVFLIDVSARAQQSGMLACVCQTIRNCLPTLPGGERTQVGFVTFDSSLHFYCLKSSLSEPQMLCVSDLDEPFLPLPAELVVNLSESRHLVEGLLDKLPSMFQGSVNPDAAMFPALQAASAMMQHIGGKLLIFQAVLPTLGRQTVRPREDTKAIGTDQESKLLNPASDAFKSHALEVCSKSQISVDVFCCCEHYADLATISPLCKYTNGQLWYFPNFEASRDGDTLQSDLTRALTRQIGFEAVMRVRASKGMKISAFHGNYYLRGADLLALPTCDSDKAFVCDLVHEEQNITNTHVCIQCALLYTTSDGERRIRVHNLNIPVTQNLPDVFSTVDVPVTMSSLLRSAVEQALATKLMDARSKIQSSCVTALKNHRIMNNSPLPDQIKLLPLFVLSSLKGAVLRDGVEVRSDERVALMTQLGSASVATTTAFLYPSLFALHAMAGTDAGTVQDGVVVMPPCVKLSAEAMEAHGLYLIDNGVMLLLWIGKNVSQQALQDLLNLPSADRLDGAKVNLPALQSDLSTRTCNVVGRIRQERVTGLPLYTIRQGGTAEPKMLQLLVEDRTMSTMSYAEWWAALARQLA